MATESSHSSTLPLVKLSGISKRFQGVLALDSVDFVLNRGEVVGLIGENGAGKSTLVKILSGIHRPDSGVVQIEGAPSRLSSPRDAQDRGIGVIHQELEVIDTLDLAGNVFLGREPTWGGVARLIDRRRMREETRRWLGAVGLALDPKTPLSRLPIAQRQLVGIARALSMRARTLIMDEPTASLTGVEAERLLAVVRELRADGVGVIYISHRLEEIRTLADRVVVLRDGRVAGSLEGGRWDRERIIRMMVGRDLASPHPAGERRAGEVVFEIRNLRTARYPASAVSLSIRRGEITGLAGLIGAGRSDLAEAVFGVQARVSGEVRLGGQSLTIRSPRDAVRYGIALVPEDRRSRGLVMGMSVGDNLTLPFIQRLSWAGWIQRSRERTAITTTVEAVGIRMAAITSPVETLSGGNQQKVVLARWLASAPRVLILDEPTRGVDVGARADIYGIVRRLADSGVGVLVISSDMEEIMTLSDRVAVMHEGRLTGCLEAGECSPEAIMRLAVA